MKKHLVVIGALALAAGNLSPALAEGVTKEQGDAILNELRQIRGILERQQKPQQPAPAPPQEERVRLTLSPADRVLGNPKAPVVLIEYTDYQCPYCGRFATATLPELKKKYVDTGKVRFVARDYPLDFHKDALKAAQALRCAGEQGKFWEMKEKLAANPANVGKERVEELARSLSLDMASFQSCTAGDRHVAEIRKGIDEAQRMGISGTPTFILGRASGNTVEGVKIVGALPAAAFAAKIEELLK